MLRFSNVVKIKGSTLPASTSIDFDVHVLNDSNNDHENTFEDKRRIRIDVNARNLFPFGGINLSPKYFIYNSAGNVVASLNNHSPSYIEGADTFNYCNGSTYNTNSEIWLPNGQYELVTETDSTPGNDGCPNVVLENFISVTLSYYDDDINVPKLKKEAGGLRVKEILNYDHTDDLITKRSFEYILNDTPSVSSGSLPVLPKYEDIHVYMNTPDPGTTQEWVRYSGSLLQLGSSIGHVKYSEVTVNQINTNAQNLKTIYKYSMGDDDEISMQRPYSPPISLRPYKKGLLTNEIVYESSGGTFTPIYETIYEYGYSGQDVEALKVSRDVTGDCTCLDPTVFAAERYVNSIGFSQILNKKTKAIFGPSILEQESIFTYDSNLSRTISNSVETYDSEALVTTFTYPDTDDPSPINTEMENKKMTSIPVKVERSKADGTMLSTEYTKYKNWGSGIIAPEFVRTAKGAVTTNNPLENRLVHYSYDALGNVRELAKADGTRIVYVMGYNHTLPVAKIENATLSGIAQGQLEDIYTASNTGTEADLINALTILRNALPNAQVTTYTYKPLIGISTITDPGGYKMTYHYDPFNRLKFVKDKDGHVLSENEYNFKN